MKFQKAQVPGKATRQSSEGERVQAGYYANGKTQWKLGTIIKKFSQLHYLIKLDDGYTFERHIDQITKTDIKQKSQPPIELDQSSQQNTRQYERHSTTIADLITFSSKSQNQHDQQQVPPEIIHHEPLLQQPQINVPIQVYEPPQANEPQIQDKVPAPRRSTRTRQAPTYLKEFVKS